MGVEAPEAQAPAPVDPPQPPGPVALADIPIPVEKAPPLAPDMGSGMAAATGPQPAGGPGDIESFAATRRTRVKAKRKRDQTSVRLPLAIAAMIALVAAVCGLRKDVVRHVPQLASFYRVLGMPVNLRGMAFTDLKIGNEIHDGVPVLVVEGAIVSMTSKQVDVPRLRFALRNASGAEIYAWTTQPPQPALEPFELRAVPQSSCLAARRGPRCAGALLQQPRRGRKRPLRRPWHES